MITRINSEMLKNYSLFGNSQVKQKTIKWHPINQKHKDYREKAKTCLMSVAEGAVRSGKTIDNCVIAANYLDKCQDRIHLASGSSVSNAKLNIGDCNGFGLEHLFRGRCRWGKYLDNEALFINSKTGEKIILFVGGGKANSYRKILGSSIGLWIATEINEHYDDQDAKTSFIKIAFDRQIASRNAKVLWDLNPSDPNHKIYKEYIDKYLVGFVGGYNYQHFTIDDNLSVTEEKKEELKSQYTVGTLWYRRNLLGERAVAEGLIYEYFANNPNEFIVDDNYLRSNQIAKITVGVDFGGNQSATCFVATALTLGFREVVVVLDRRIKKNITALELENEFIDFCNTLYNLYEKGFYTEADSTESILISSLSAAANRKFAYTQIYYALKSPIIGRIKGTNKLIAQKRLKVLKRCTETKNAFISASWNPKKPDERLDNASYENPVDILDPFEYSIEKDLDTLVKI